MQPGIIALISALGGIFISQVFNLIITLIRKNSENKKEIMKQIVSTSMDQWKQSFELAKLKKGKAELMPLISYIITNSMTADLIGKKSVSDEEIKAFYKERDRINSLIYKLAKKSKEERAY